MKTVKRSIRVLSLSAVLLFSAVLPLQAQNARILDQAIEEASGYLIGQLPNGAKVALTSFETPSGHLSDYIFEEMWTRFEKARKFVMVDRRNQDRIDAEINYQYSGKVDDDKMVSMTRQYGAEIIVHGVVVPLGHEYRLTVYSTDVEKALSNQHVVMLRGDSRLSTLLVSTPDYELERAVTAMARALDKRTTVAVGRIAYIGTGSVSSLSAWLKNQIMRNALKQRERIQVASDGEAGDFASGLAAEAPASNGAVQALITGTYSHRDSDAEITLQLVSAGGGRELLSSTHFVITASDLERRRLSILPPKDTGVISKAEYDQKQQAVIPYQGANNQWAFTLTPDALDGIYHDGSYMSFLVYSSRDCYFKITHVDVNGDTQVIYPTTQKDDNFIRAGQTRRIPDNTRFRMGPPFGEELILAAAYDRQFSLPSSSANGPLSASLITRSLNADNMTPKATAKFSYTILPR
jgi:TolB-like protein